MLILKALDFAREAHEGKLRKYTEIPYIFHLINVGFILSTITDDDEIIAAGILHDTLEDTNATADDLLNLFRERITGFVLDVTDVSKLSDGNRKVRKAIDREHLAAAAPESKTIKLADIIDNTRSIIEYDPAFARVYLQEKKDLLPYLSQGNSNLYEKAYKIIYNE